LGKSLIKQQWFWAAVVGVAVVIVFLVVFLLPETVVPYGTLRVAMPSFSYHGTIFDPIYSDAYFGGQLFDPIVTWDEGGNFVPAIAEDWSLSEDGLTWTFEIREGVAFHNGDPLTSADVMFSVERMKSLDATTPWSYLLRYNFDTMSCPDDHTFVYKTVEPEPPLIMAFACTGVVPRDYIEENGVDYFREHLVGSGPWKFVSFTSGQECVMEANTEHWRTVPAFERLIQYVVPEEAEQIAMLERGEVDIITGISFDKVVELRDEGYTLQPVGYPLGVNLVFGGTWLTDGPTSDIRVRRALAYSINYQELCDTFFYGFAEPGGRWFMHDRCWGWDSTWEPEPYDLALTQDLLEQANYPEAFDDPVITIYVRTGLEGKPWTWLPELISIIQGYWTAAGIQTEIQMLGWPEWDPLFFYPANEPGAPNLGAILPWAWYNIWPTNVYHSFNIYCPGCAHGTSNDPQALELYEKAIRELDPDLAEQYWAEFQDYAHDMWVNFGVCLVWNQYVLGPEVGEFDWGNWLSIADAYCGIQHEE
jgi:ABC-type transport system substrate-binding protein